MRIPIRLDSASGGMPRRFLLRAAGAVMATLLLGLAQPSALAATERHHETVAGIPTPLASAVGAVVLVLVILVAVTLLTRDRNQGEATARPEKPHR